MVYAAFGQLSLKNTRQFDTCKKNQKQLPSERYTPQLARFEFTDLSSTAPANKKHRNRAARGRCVLPRSLSEVCRIRHPHWWVRG